MELAQLLPGIVGAFFGAFGWLLVGVYIQRRQFMRMARNAARAVYFELDVNRLSIEVALAFGSFTPLARSSFERLLPELATLLQAEELRTIVAAYLGHAGYQQVASDADLPAQMRTQALERLRAAHLAALDLLPAPGVLGSRGDGARCRGAHRHRPGRLTCRSTIRR